MACRAIQLRNGFDRLRLDLRQKRTPLVWTFLVLELVAQMNLLAPDRISVPAAGRCALSASFCSSCQQAATRIIPLTSVPLTSGRPHRRHCGPRQPACQSASEAARHSEGSHEGTSPAAGPPPPPRSE
jgi:hypothetical protein